jgi:hypothetical protein
MATHAERLLVLEMVRDKKITAAEGAQLIEALGVSVSSDWDVQTHAEVRIEQKLPHWFHLRVTDANTGAQRVNLHLPLALVSSGLKAGAHVAPEIGGVDVDRVLEAIDAGVVGQITDELDQDTGKRVEIFLE